MAQVVLLTGRPGAGKTTLLRSIIRRLPYRAGGFITQEIRSGKGRVGFEIINLNGQKGILAHVESPGQLRVGKYGVNVADLDRIGTRAIREALSQADYIVIDEIGRMEMFSAAFRVAVEEALAGENIVLATIMSRPHPWPDRIKQHPQAVLCEVTRENRAVLVERTAEPLERWLRTTDDS